MLNSDQIRKKFLNFWKSPPQDHKEISNASLVPNIDSTLLFVNSGMFPLAPYLAGQKHPSGKRLCNLQRCLRTKYDEMMEIGDNRHTLMFEMMGNWSLNDYFKEKQIPWMLELHVEHYGLDPNRLYVSVWAGDELVSRDNEAIEIWQKAFAKYGINAKFSEDISQIPKNLKEGENFPYRIFPFGKSDNWWQRGEAPGELGGPCSEIFFDTGHIEKPQDNYHINDDSGRFIEIGNSVFMQYKLDQNQNWQPLKQKNIDFGGGFERVVMCIQNKKDIFETDIYEPIINTISEISQKNYKTNNQENNYTKYFRILADHSRAAVFILADGIIPSNKDQGYILRRFIRRLVRYGIKLGIDKNFTKNLSLSVIHRMQKNYPHLKQNQVHILNEIEKEEIKFKRTLNKGLKEIEKLKEKNTKLTGKKAFYIYETFGFPLEMTLDEFEIQDNIAQIIEKEFKNEMKKHRELSRKGAKKKFEGGLADKSEKTTALHTAHHLLLSALKKVLGTHVTQKGSNITAERLRIDFSHDKPLTDDQKLEIENIVNNQIRNKLNVIRIEMDKKIAEKIGAEMEFGQKYKDRVSIYFIGDIPENFAELIDLEDNDDIINELKKFNIFSMEFCGGPHVKNLKKLYEFGKFQIIKEKSSGAGIRRIKAILK